MDYKNIISRLDDKQIEELAQYAPQCTEQSLDNIKNIFLTKTHSKKKPAPKKKMLFAASIAAAFLLFSGFVYAGIIDLNKIYEMAFGNSAEYMSQYGTIINGGNSDNGIQLNLLSAIKDEDKMLVFFNLTDTSEDRLSATMDLYDSWALDQGNGGNCRLLSYDENTKTASFVITSVGASTNKTATLTIKSFLKSLEFRKNLKENGIDIISALSDYKPEVIPFSQVRGDGIGAGIAQESKYSLSDDSLDNFKVLQADQVAIEFQNINWSTISNVGFIDGELHIQTKPIDNTFSNIMNMHFVDENNTPVFTNELSINYGKRVNGTGGAYDEFVFENIKEISQLQNLRLVIDVAEYGDYFTGNWSASFKVPPQARKITIPVQDTIMLANEAIKADIITLSPLGLTIQYKTEILNPTGDNTDKAFITYNNSTVVDFQSKSRGVNEKNCTYTFSDPIIEIEKVVSVTINEKEFSVGHQ